MLLSVVDLTIVFVVVTVGVGTLDSLVLVTTTVWISNVVVECSVSTAVLVVIWVVAGSVDVTSSLVVSRRVIVTVEVGRTVCAVRVLIEVFVPT